MKRKPSSDILVQWFLPTLRSSFDDRFSVVSRRNPRQVMSTLRLEDRDQDGRLDPFEVAQGMRKLAPLYLGLAGAWKGAIWS